MKNINLLNHLVSQYDKSYDDLPYDNALSKESIKSRILESNTIESVSSMISSDDLTTLADSCYSNPKFLNTALASHISYSFLNSNPNFEKYIVNYQNECTSSYKSISSAIENSLKNKTRKTKSFSLAALSLNDKKVLNPAPKSDKYTLKVNSMLIGSEKPHVSSLEQISSQTKLSDLDDDPGLIFCNFDHKSNLNNIIASSSNCNDDIIIRSDESSSIENKSVTTLQTELSICKDKQEDLLYAHINKRVFDLNPPKKDWGPISRNLVSVISETIEECNYRLTKHHKECTRIFPPSHKINELSSFIFDVTDYLYINCLTGTVLAIYSNRLLRRNKKSNAFKDNNKGLFISLLILAIKMATPENKYMDASFQKISMASDGEFSLKELAYLENELLNLLDYNLWVSCNDINNFIQHNTYGYLDSILAYYQFEDRLEKRKNDLIESNFSTNPSL
ncbi:hypothetical protein BB561_005047 [Smittium simulii]|uniref:Cyclin N-terminal domain-containing protein n=1 Tax=Smittium simulii TaxID=133385 RepID=A0A2T9YCK8_9FUNG|nr:hypothetical protein BB561_005047 [Smittium simulii]